MRLTKTYIYTILLISLANSLENNIGGSLALNGTFLAKLTYRPSISCLVVNMLYLDYWKDVKEHEDKYSGSYWGYIRGWGRVVNNNGGKRFVKGRMLKPYLDCRGYLIVGLCNGIGKVNKRVHRLIAETFIPNPNNYPQINHNITPTKTINCVPNLEWCNNSMNTKHAYKNGLSSQIGEKNSRSKLTEKQAIEIKARLLQGQRNLDLAKEYGVGGSVISNIKAGRIWSHINV